MEVSSITSKCGLLSSLRAESLYMYIKIKGLYSYMWVCVWCAVCVHSVLLE